MPSSSPLGLGQTPQRVLRVSREIESIGARVAMSKKRVTWQFVFADDEQVHTVVLEHSRVTAKKRLHLDGRKLYSSEHFCAGDWTHTFQVAVDHPARFCVTIKDVKASVVDSAAYQLAVDDTPWDQLAERKLPRVRGSKSIWSSELFARRVSEEEEVLQGKDDEGKMVEGKAFSWTFAFGTHGTIHRLELRDVERDGQGEFMVILDSRLLTRVLHDDIDADFWEYECHATEEHTLTVLVTLEDEGKRNDFSINGCAWQTLSETDFVLQPEWFPVFSRSRGTSYFRNAQTGVCQWERPIQSRHGSVIDVPRRASKQEEPVPTDEFNAEGLRLSNELDEEEDQDEPSTTAVDGASAHTAQAAPAAEEINLIDFSEMAVHASPSAKAQAPTGFTRTSSIPAEPVLDLLS